MSTFDAEEVPNGLIIDGLFVPKHGLYGIRRDKMPWGRPKIDPFPRFWYFNTTDSLASPKPMLEDEAWVQVKAERSLDYLIIFEATVDEINNAEKERQWKS